MYETPKAFIRQWAGSLAMSNLREADLEISKSRRSPILGFLTIKRVVQRKVLLIKLQKCIKYPKYFPPKMPKIIQNVRKMF